MNLLQDAPRVGLGPSAAPPPTSAVPPGRPTLAPVVSVCIANWNCRDLLRKCLHSLFAQDQGVPFEVVVVDNASADAAADMVESEFPQVVLVRNAENVGFSRASNQAAELACGEYLFFLNNDAEVSPFALLEFTAYADAHPEVGMIGPRLRGTDGADQISYRRKPTLAALFHRISLLRWTGVFRRAYYRYRRDTFDPDGVKPVEALMGAAVFLPRAAFQAAGRWDEAYRFGVEDLDLSAQVGRRAGVVYVSHVQVLHHGRVSSRANIGFAAPNVAVGYVRYFRKAGVSGAALLAYKLLVTLDTPVQLAGKLIQAGVRRACGKREKAAKSVVAARGLWHFLRRELVRFWQA
jgi:N-acetylglucosaminyl-diphospho-decaprenol L-rhamnosyltransferase